MTSNDLKTVQDYSDWFLLHLSEIRDAGLLPFNAEYTAVSDLFRNFVELAGVATPTTPGPVLKAGTFTGL